ncbi:unnamed protein product [Spirodela intermedia]|uniref:Uncharacterized protein n=2 Tax=Spirodela intermedia TaxID=51605 RepID=A0A7I8KT22_SPIIN|nr:unnamed protein product [Spirodela intermedia]CAA7400910.1 unnamed protein product [Spirodela intermedia]
MSPYRVLYEKTHHLPIEIEHKAYWAIKKLNLSLDDVGKSQLLQLHELQELKNEAYKNSIIYKAKMKNFHNKALRKRNLHENQKVWLYNSHLKLFPGKLKSRWNCPYVITEIFDSGAVLIIDPKTGHAFKVNGQQLKPYLEAEPPLAIVSLIFQDIPKDHPQI